MGNSVSSHQDQDTSHSVLDQESSSPLNDQDASDSNFAHLPFSMVNNPYYLAIVNDQLHAYSFLDDVSDNSPPPSRMQISSNMPETTTSFLENSQKMRSEFGVDLAKLFAWQVKTTFEHKQSLLSVDDEFQFSMDSFVNMSIPQMFHGLKYIKSLKLRAKLIQRMNDAFFRQIQSYHNNTNLHKSLEVNSRGNGMVVPSNFDGITTFSAMTLNMCLSLSAHLSTRDPIIFQIIASSLIETLCSQNLYAMRSIWLRSPYLDKSIEALIVFAKDNIHGETLEETKALALGLLLSLALSLGSTRYLLDFLLLVFDFEMLKVSPSISFPSGVTNLLDRFYSLNVKFQLPISNNKLFTESFYLEAVPFNSIESSKSKESRNGCANSLSSSGSYLFALTWRMEKDTWSLFLLKYGNGIQSSLAGQVVSTKVICQEPQPVAASVACANDKVFVLVQSKVMGCYSVDSLEKDGNPGLLSSVFQERQSSLEDLELLFRFDESSEVISLISIDTNFFIKVIRISYDSIDVTDLVTSYYRSYGSSCDSICGDSIFLGKYADVVEYICQHNVSCKELMSTKYSPLWIRCISNSKGVNDIVEDMQSRSKTLFQFQQLTSPISIIYSDGMQLSELALQYKSSPRKRIFNVMEDIIIESISYSEENVFELSSRNHQLTELFRKRFIEAVVNPVSSNELVVVNQSNFDFQPGFSSSSDSVCHIFVNYRLPCLTNSKLRIAKFASNESFSWSSFLHKHVLQSYSVETPKSLSVFRLSRYHSLNDTTTWDVTKATLQCPSELLEASTLANSSVICNGLGNHLVIQSMVSTKRDAKDSSFVYHTFDLSDGRVLESQVASLSKVDGLIHCWTYDCFNNFIWAVDWNQSLVRKWVNSGLSPLPCYEHPFVPVDEEDAVSSLTSFKIIRQLKHLAQPYVPSSYVTSNGDHTQLMEICLKTVNNSSYECMIIVRGRIIVKEDSQKKGYFVVIVDSDKVNAFGGLSYRFFDNSLVSDVDKLISFLGKVKENEIVLLANNSNTSLNLTSGLINAFQSLQIKEIETLSRKSVFAFIGCKGNALFAPVQSLGNSGKTLILRQHIPKALLLNPFCNDCNGVVLSRLIQLTVMFSMKSADRKLLASALQLLTMYMRMTSATNEEPLSEEDRESLDNLLMKELHASHEGIQQEAAQCFVASLAMLYPSPDSKLKLLQKHCLDYLSRSEVHVDKAETLTFPILQVLLSQLTEFKTCNELSIANPLENSLSLIDDILPLLFRVYSIEFHLQCQQTLLGNALASKHDSLFSQCQQSISTIYKFILFGQSKSASLQPKTLLSLERLLVLCRDLFAQVIVTSPSYNPTIDKLLQSSIISNLLNVALTFATIQLNHKRIVLSNFSESTLSNVTQQLLDCQHLIHSLIDQLPNACHQHLQEKIPETTCKVRDLESEHPYQSNMDQYVEVHITGATKCTISFSPESRTEHGCDYLKFFTLDRSSTFHPEIEMFSGRDGSQNWPGCEGRAPLIINSSRFVVYFHSDGSVQDWGYRFTIKADIPFSSSSNSKGNHWLIALSNEFSTLAATIASILILGEKYDVLLESSDNLRWFQNHVIEPSMFRLSHDWIHRGYNIFLQELVTRPSNSLASLFVQRLRSVVKEDQGTIEDVNKIVYMTCAVLFKFHHVESQAYAFALQLQANGIDSNVNLETPPELLELWRKAQSMRAYIDSLHLMTNKDHILEESNDMTTMTQDILGLGSFLLRFGELEDDVDIPSAAMSTPRSSSSRILKKRSLLKFSELIKSRRALGEKKSSRGISLMSLADKILYALQSYDCISIGDLHELHNLHNLRATRRTLGLNIMSQLLHQNERFPIACDFVSCLLLKTFDEIRNVEVVKSLVGQTYSSCKLNPLILTEAASTKHRKLLESSFQHLLTSCLAFICRHIQWLSHEDSKDSNLQQRALVLMEQESWLQSSLSGLRVLALDYSVQDHEILHSCQFVDAIFTFLDSNNSRVVNMVESVIASLISSSVLSKSQHSKFTTTLLREVVRRIKYPKRQNLVDEGKLNEEDYVLVDDILSIRSNEQGFSFCSFPLSLQHTISLWIKRPHVPALDDRNEKVLTLGCIVMRGPDFDLQVSNERSDGFIGNTGVVVEIVDAITYWVVWDEVTEVMPSKKTTRTKYIFDIEGKMEIVPASKALDGLIYSKGCVGVTLQNKKNLNPWEFFGLKMFPSARVGVVVSSGDVYEPFVMMSKSFIPAEQWVLVTITQDKETSSIYINGSLDVSKTITNEMLYPNKPSTIHILESPHPYYDSQDIYEIVRYPGASSFSISFDSRSKTESQYDYIKFYSSTSRSTQFGENFSGGRNGTSCNFPGMGNRKSLTIPGDSFEFHFHSDNSNNDWGYKIYCKVNMAIGSESVDVDISLNDSPWFFGQLPSYACTSVEMIGLPCNILKSTNCSIANMRVKTHVALNANDIANVFTSSRQLVNDSTNHRSVSYFLTFLQQFIRTYSQTLDVDLQADILRALLSLHQPSGCELKSIIWKVLQEVLPRSSSKIINIVANELGFLVDNSFLKFLLCEIGKNYNIWRRIALTLKNPRECKIRESIHDELRTIDILTGTVHILVTQCDDWKQEFESLLSNFLTSSLQNVLNTLKQSTCEFDISSTKFQGVANSEMDLLYSFIVLFGGSYSPLAIGQKIKYRDDKGIVEFGQFIKYTTATLPKNKTSIESIEDFVFFGGTCVISLASSPQVELEVPIFKVEVAEEQKIQQSIDMIYLNIQLSRSFFRSILELDTTDRRVRYKQRVEKTIVRELVFESTHPLSNDKSAPYQKLTRISIPEADKLYISFDERTCLDVVDKKSKRSSREQHISFFSDSSQKTAYGVKALTSNFPMKLEIPANNCVMFFHSRKVISSTNPSPWGFKVTVTGEKSIRVDPPIQHVVPNECILTHLSMLTCRAIHRVVENQSNNHLDISSFIDILQLLFPKAFAMYPQRLLSLNNVSDNKLVFESSHPYENDLDSYIPVRVPGARRLIVTFDVQSSTERNCDYVKIFKDSNHDTTWHSVEYFSGGMNASSSNWPGVNDQPPLIIDGNSFEIYFHSDGSVTSWGWKLYVTSDDRGLKTESLELCDPMSTFTQSMLLLNGGFDMPKLMSKLNEKDLNSFEVLKNTPKFVIPSSRSTILCIDDSTLSSNVISESITLLDLTLIEEAEYFKDPTELNEKEATADESKQTVSINEITLIEEFNHKVVLSDSKSSETDEMNEEDEESEETYFSEGTFSDDDEAEWESLDDEDEDEDDSFNDDDDDDDDEDEDEDEDEDDEDDEDDGNTTREQTLSSTLHPMFDVTRTSTLETISNSLTQRDIAKSNQSLLAREFVCGFVASLHDFHCITNISMSLLNIASFVSHLEVNKHQRSNLKVVDLFGDDLTSTLHFLSICLDYSQSNMHGAQVFRNALRVLRETFFINYDTCTESLVMFASRQLFESSDDEDFSLQPHVRAIRKTILVSHEEDPCRVHVKDARHLLLMFTPFASNDNDNDMDVSISISNNRGQVIIDKVPVRQLSKQIVLPQVNDCLVKIHASNDTSTSNRRGVGGLVSLSVHGILDDIPRDAISSRAKRVKSKRDKLKYLSLAKWILEGFFSSAHRRQRQRHQGFQVNAKVFCGLRWYLYCYLLIENQKVIITDRKVLECLIDILAILVSQLDKNIVCDVSMKKEIDSLQDMMEKLLQCLYESETTSGVNPENASTLFHKTMQVMMLIDDFYNSRVSSLLCEEDRDRRLVCFSEHKDLKLSNEKNVSFKVTPKHLIEPIASFSSSYDITVVFHQLLGDVQLFVDFGATERIALAFPKIYETDFVFVEVKFSETEVFVYTYINAHFHKSYLVSKPKHVSFDDSKNRSISLNQTSFSFDVGVEFGVSGGSVRLYDYEFHNTVISMIAIAIRDEKRLAYFNQNVAKNNNNIVTYFAKHYLNDWMQDVLRCKWTMRHLTNRDKDETFRGTFSFLYDNMVLPLTKRIDNSHELPMDLQLSIGNNIFVRAESGNSQSLGSLRFIDSLGNKHSFSSASIHQIKKNWLLPFDLHELVQRGIAWRFDEEDVFAGNIGEVVHFTNEKVFVLWNGQDQVFSYPSKGDVLMPSKVTSRDSSMLLTGNNLSISRESGESMEWTIEVSPALLMHEVWQSPLRSNISTLCTILAPQADSFLMRHIPSCCSLDSVGKKLIVKPIVFTSSLVIEDVPTDFVADFLVYRGVQISRLNELLMTYVEVMDLFSDDSVLGNLVRDSRCYIIESVKSFVLQRGLNRTEGNGSTFELRLSRSRARKFLASHPLSKDIEGRFLVFSQAFRQIHHMDSAILRRKDKIYNVTFIGEHSQDAGGPYRESFAIYVEELQSQGLSLLIHVPNYKQMVGSNRDQFLVNPRATSPVELEMFCFLGKLMGIAMRSEEFLALSLSSIIWKRLVHEPLGWEDLEAIDFSLARSLEFMRSADRETFDSSFDICFAVPPIGDDSTSTIIDLLENGQHESVTFERREEYIEKVLQFRLHEFDAQIDAIRQGLGMIIPLSLLSLLTWKELEVMVCGKAEIDIALLQSVTEYSACSFEDRHVKLFWQVMEEFSNEERSAVLRFVWGRSRLPLQSKSFSQKFKIQSCSRNPPDNYLPVSHTCFFSLELPQYSNIEIMREKLRYAIWNCMAIDTDETSAGFRNAGLGWET